MSALPPELYRRLAGLADAWQARHWRELKRETGVNPRLTVDALCFTPCPQRPGWVVGAWLTPKCLSLAMVGESVSAHDEDSVMLSLPSGRYRLRREAVSVDDSVWLCPLLEDLRDLEGHDDACRLAQRLMASVMAEPGQTPVG
ncbi:[NiFe]-hydrogenase assembly chaperone HybE [Halomonas sp. V046]|uniref:[NiFe]-hydrogenase assembly chaperone HybE n=1 Tax=Halomonas sp. V046 TaxID=3459611 RepID=UPI0040441570